MKFALALVLVAACGGGGGANNTDGGGGDDDVDGGSGSNPGSDAGSGSQGCTNGTVSNGIECVPADPNDPAQRAQADVCTRWAADHVLTDNHPFTAGSGGDCDDGTLSAGGKADALKRINGFRWLVGLGPTTESASLDATDQECANMESWWNFSGGGSPHAPPSTTKCYTATGASGAGMSNIAWGQGPALSIDQFMEDDGNETTLGHRRWIMNPKLGPVGIGYWEGGGTYGSAECLAVFGQSGTSNVPKWVSQPNPGFVPVVITTWTWSFSSALAGTANAQIAMTRMSDGMSLPVTRMTLSQGYGQDTISWKPMGWTPAAGETYKVTVSGLTQGDVSYVVKPISC
ncbi:MAG TPA: CAP domain-containing protein [Kofleriaceae bacterium]|jgi:hypothetical protein